jgi:hypothetical protein
VSLSLCRRQFGAGPDARRLERLAEENQKRQRDALTFARSSGPLRQPVVEALFEAWADYSKENWDGEEALAVPQNRLEKAIALVEDLPRRFPAPDGYGDRDGDFSLEWYRGPRRNITVSIGAGGLLHWAALIGDDDPRGTWRYSPEAGDSAPEMLCIMLGRIFRS